RLRVRKNAVPAVEWMFLMLPALLFGDVGERRAENGFFARRRRGIRALPCRRGRERAMAPCDALEKTGKVFLLFRRETVRRFGDDGGRRHGGIQAPAGSPSTAAGLPTATGPGAA